MGADGGKRPSGNERLPAATPARFLPRGDHCEGEGRELPAKVAPEWLAVHDDDDLRPSVPEPTSVRRLLRPFLAPNTGGDIALNCCARSMCDRKKRIWMRFGNFSAAA
jgi:hypothetical protein